MKTKIFLIFICSFLFIIFIFKGTSFKTKSFYFSLNELIKFTNNIKVDQEKLSLIYEYFHDGNGDFFAIQELMVYQKIITMKYL